MDTNKTFKLTEIVKIFNIKRHFVIHLVERDIIKPLLDMKGRGKSRVYSYKNLIEIGIFIYLNKLDLSYEMANRILKIVSEYLENYPKYPVPYIKVVGLLDGEIEISSTTESNLHKLLLTHGIFIDRDKKFVRKGKDVVAYCFILNIGGIISYINSKIE